MQEAAKDLVNVEEEAMGEEHGGERREDDGGGEEGAPARMDEEEEEDEGVKAEKGVGEEAGGARIEGLLPEEGVGEKQGRALETVSRDVSSGVGGDVGTTRNGEEQGGARTGALTGEGERCLELGLKAEGAMVRSESWPGVAMDG